VSGPEDWYREDDPDFDLGGPDRGCQFPGECCMPGDHTADECHTAEMIESYEDDGQA
jgi:hypothetical protein